MAFPTGLNQAQVLSMVQSKLIAVREALDSITDLYGWTSGLLPADIETATGLDANDAGTLLSAVSDANAVAVFYDTGLPPSQYPQPSTAYPYAASQRQVIGPL
jgi:hypothetical protein